MVDNQRKHWHTSTELGKVSKMAIGVFHYHNHGFGFMTLGLKKS